MTELYAEIDDLNDRNSELEQQVRSISLTRDELVRERDELAAHVERLEPVVTGFLENSQEAIELLDSAGSADNIVALVADLNKLANDAESIKQAPKISLSEHDAEVARKAEERLIHALFYAPSSPILPKHAEKVRDWWPEFKEAKRVKDGE